MTSCAYMLDTNIVSDLLKNPRGGVSRKVRHYGIEAICVSSIVASEMRYGALKRGSARLVDAIEDVLSRIQLFDYDDSAAVSYAAMRCGLERRGSPIGTTDLFIAAHALSLDLTLVTDNVREFSRVEGLKVENWIERDGVDDK
ncbi:type II toxin-antitoxin system VapC family toxin [Rhizobium sp. KVB221]|uniref:Ribonuclease VapC n=1 Tax=Rhizobium setariae TaxID=2801340 RepID=A0A937CJJ8_9HYPH|nr:type II toxin-antitoxin system VapC family toxin [Rhizobium setariae]MBL0371180.1 type II toxin-antitoxin system VapC family toxin [Rhizobium setariae]